MTDIPPSTSHRSEGHHAARRLVSSDNLRLGHEVLLTLAHKFHAAAVDGDLETLEQATTRFLDALTAHLSDESVQMTRLIPAEARILTRGQTRLLTLATELAADATAGCPAQPTRAHCASRARDLLAALLLQAKDEQVALRQTAA